MKSKKDPAVGTTENGGPDFAGSDFIYPAVEGQEFNAVSTPLSGSYGADSQMANFLAGFEETPPGWSWHHLDDFDPTTGDGTVQLIQQSAHEATYLHFGGAGQFFDFRGWGYGR